MQHDLLDKKLWIFGVIGEEPADALRLIGHAEKERIFQEIEAESPESRLARSRPLNAKERRQWQRFQAKAKANMGRPKVGQGAKTISLTVEKSLLKQADVYAKRHGISRAQLVAQGLRAILGKAA
jgi:hypothetical protein